MVSSFRYIILEVLTQLYCNKLTEKDVRIMYPLDDTKSKLRRAKVHINALDRSIKRFIEKHPYDVQWKHYDDMEILAVRVEAPKEPPINWGLIFGDAVTNLRASLDHIAWQLSKHSGIQFPTDAKERGRAERNISFPILDDQNNRFFKNATMYMPDEAKQIIKELQPYDENSESLVPPLLSMLNKLANHDKHRVNIPSFHQYAPSLTSVIN